MDFYYLNTKRGCKIGSHQAICDHVTMTECVNYPTVTRHKLAHSLYAHLHHSNVLGALGLDFWMLHFDCHRLAIGQNRLVDLG